jgi:hypothetical protein
VIVLHLLAVSFVTNILEEHAASLFRVEVRRMGNKRDNVKAHSLIHYYMSKPVFSD